MIRRFPNDWENNYQDHETASLRAFKLPPNSSGKIYICYKATPVAFSSAFQ